MCSRQYAPSTHSDVPRSCEQTTTCMRECGAPHALGILSTHGNIFHPSVLIGAAGTVFPAYERHCFDSSGVLSGTQAVTMAADPISGHAQHLSLLRTHWNCEMTHSFCQRTSESETMPSVSLRGHAAPMGTDASKVFSKYVSTTFTHTCSSVRSYGAHTNGAFCRRDGAHLQVGREQQVLQDWSSKRHWGFKTLAQVCAHHER